MERFILRIIHFSSLKGLNNSNRGYNPWTPRRSPWTTLTYMSTFRQIYYQIVFGTKYREPTLSDSYCNDLYGYISGLLQNKKCTPYQINGIEDHIHIFCDLHPTIALSDFVKDIKVASSLWIKGTGNFPDFIGWQDGYGAFTYSIREKDMIIGYVTKQKEHHRKETFPVEFKRLLRENGVEFDERYLL